MIEIKICGLQPGDNLEFADNSRVTHVGFVFVPASRRYVNPTAAGSCVVSLPPDCKAMGVFTDASVSEVLQTASEAGLHGVQLHGVEPSEWCRELRFAGLEVWKAISVRDNDDADALYQRLRPYASVVDAILLDAAPPKQNAAGVTGGYGQQFSWTVLPELQARIQKSTDPWPAIWIAGGLTPDNIHALLDVFQPVGVDISSGVETEGRKDLQKIKEFIQGVERFDRNQSVS